MKKKKESPKLKQWLVSGAKPGAGRVQKAAFIMQTCGHFARAEFKKLFPECDVWGVTQTAESDWPKEWLDDHDPWLGPNYVLIDEDKER